jgi:glutamate-ammonia-ligase adenylyltransferase
MVPTMKPTADQLRRRCPDVEPALIDQHLARLEDAYFQQFDLARIASHIQGLARLSTESPVQVQMSAGQGGRVELTVLSHDHPGVFSLITGTLAGLGFGIEQGLVFTYGRAEDRAQAPASTRRRFGLPRRRGHAGRTRRRRIIDHFRGALHGDVDIDTFTQRFSEELTRAIGRMEADPKAGPADARHRTNEMVTQRLSRLEIEQFPVLYPVELDIREADDGRTHLRIKAQDTPAFLYSLSNALAMMGMSIETVRADTSRGMVEDDIGFVDQRGRPVNDQATLDRVRLVVLLTKQFTYYLDKSPDPYTALSRFEQMVEDLLRRDDPQAWTDMLSDPTTMQRLARLLGASDYLWEDFIRMQYEALLPILRQRLDEASFAHDRDSLDRRLADELDHASTPSARRKALNRFKDQEVYLIDLEQILNPELDFREFSRKLTALAEAVIGAAAGQAYAALVSEHGRPLNVAGHECPWSICGLGKLGGEALGYASDVELLFVYEGSGQTDGQHTIHTGEFFNLLAREVSHWIEAKQEGIFRVDLRVRPYGKNAPLATSMETMRRYYADDGDAMEWERMALVRLRPVAGDADYGRTIEKLRDELIYCNRRWKLDELWDMRRRQWQQKKDARGLFNAKYAPGALVDVEYAVQTLQVANGHDHPDLRTPRIHQALAALTAAKVIDADDARALATSYRFMRQLINGLRMLRGSAKDLFVPPTDDPALVYLARRMNYEGDDAAEQLLADIDRHARMTRRFVARCFGPEALPEGPNHAD